MEPTVAKRATRLNAGDVAASGTRSAGGGAGRLDALGLLGLEGGMEGSNGLLDPKARPENLRKLIPTRLPSGRPVHNFQP